MTLTVLGIESSCDETAASVVRVHSDMTGQVVSDIVASQIDEHAPYGGVVPEIASRSHLRAIGPVISQAVQTAGGWEKIDGIAVTAGPGLAGCLLVGVQTAKGLAWSRNLPIVGVNHLHGHLLAAFLERPLAIGTRPEFPFIGLLVSGGHTALYRVSSPDEITELGSTRDDAAGEAFDKVAKLCGLGYPGGPVIDALAVRGDPKAIAFPRPLRQKTSLEFSFSGLKTAVANYVTRLGHLPQTGGELENLAASVQLAIVETLVTKTIAAVRQEGVTRVVISGGVAANRGLRARASERCRQLGISLHVPPAVSCTDNAAMIAFAGALRLKSGHNDQKLNTAANWPLSQLSNVPFSTETLE